MGMVSTEQAVRIIEAVKQPEVVTIAKESSNVYWWTGAVALITVLTPIIIALIRRKRR